jgi:hypothetical protein
VEGFTMKKLILLTCVYAFFVNNNACGMFKIIPRSGKNIASTRPFHWHTPIPTDSQGYAKHQRELNSWKNRRIAITMNETRNAFFKKHLQAKLREIEMEDERLLQLELLELERKNRKNNTES